MGKAVRERLQLGDGLPQLRGTPGDFLFQVAGMSRQLYLRLFRCVSSPRHCRPVCSNATMFSSGSGNSVRSSSCASRPRACTRVKPYMTSAERFQ